MIDVRQGINLKYWILGFLSAFLIIWIISFFFVATLVVYTWSSDVGRMIRVPGSVIQNRDEGWGTSHFGQYDVVGVDDISKNKIPTIAIWGNSHVEAFGVEQWERMEKILISMWKTDGDNFTAFGVGDSGESIVDYFFKIYHYEKICPSIIAHFIIITDPTEAFPDQSVGTRSVFQSKPEYQLIEGNRILQYQRIKSILARYRLDFLWSPATNLIKNTKLRFSLGPHKVESQNSKIVDTLKPKEAFSFILNAFRCNTNKPIILIYCPYIPVISKGEVSLKDPNKYISVLAEECRNNRIDFIDLTQDFCNYYWETGKFPRGFANSRPSEGHFNAAGHYLVAEAIYRYIMNGRFDDVIYAN